MLIQSSAAHGRGQEDKPVSPPHTHTLLPLPPPRDLSLLASPPPVTCSFSHCRLLETWHLRCSVPEGGGGGEGGGR